MQPKKNGKRLSHPEACTFPLKLTKHTVGSKLLVEAIYNHGPQLEYREAQFPSWSPQMSCHISNQNYQ